MPTPPHILLVLCHDLGRRLGCYGVPHLKTPFLDAFADSGVVCESYFATAPLCSPSRGSIMTGLYPHSNGLMGLVNRNWDMPDTYPTLAQVLRGNGYLTELFGGTCCSKSVTGHYPVLFGFHHEKREAHRMGYQEHRHERVPHTCDSVSADFLEWLRARPSNSPPFFACLGFLEVHRVFKDPRYAPDDPDKVHVPPYLTDSAEVREDLADLHGMIHAVDATMETILEAIENAAIASNTLVIFSTDHGIAFPRAKSTLYDPGIETALILRWPEGFGGGSRYRSLLSNIDLLPTILECAGHNVPAHVQGQSFLAMLRNERYEPRKAIFAEKTWHDVYDPIRAIRTESFKYIRNFPGESGDPPDRRPLLNLPTDIEKSLSREALAKAGDKHLGPRQADELYDLNRDADELRNIAGDRDYSSVVTELRSGLLSWMEDTDDPLLRGFVPAP